jgi:hypothetical protein
MKIILLFICAAGLLASTGCVFPRDHDRGDEHRPPMAHDERSNGVDHGEYPGDKDHDPNR